MSDGALSLEGKEPQKLEELCNELARHNIGLAAISEHRWKGEGVYQVNAEWKFIYSGLPLEAPKAQSGAGFLLHASLFAAWRAAGEFCEFGGARLLKLRLKIAGRLFSVISVYAPTFQCSDVEKEGFYDNLGAMLKSTNSRDELVVMGDFNARVGIQDLAESEQSGIQLRDPVGRFGLPEVNDNGGLLLEFCASQHKHNLRIMSTCFQHKHYGTWYHPSSRKWFQIDHVICSRRTGGLVQDVQVMPGYAHETDHRCVKLKLRIPAKKCLGRFYGRHHNQGRDMRPVPLNVSRLTDPSVQEAYKGPLHELASDGLFDEGYELFGYALRKVGEAKVGMVVPGKSAPWKEANQEKLAELSDLKRQARNPRNPHDANYKSMCKKVKTETRKMLNQWWSSKARSIQDQVDAKDHNHQFAGYRELRTLLVKPKGVSPRLKDHQVGSGQALGRVLF